MLQLLTCPRGGREGGLNPFIYTHHTMKQTRKWPSMEAPCSSVFWHSVSTYVSSPGFQTHREPLKSSDFTLMWISLPSIFRLRLEGQR